MKTFTVEVTQVDREAAAKLLGGAAPEGLLEGRKDHMSLVRALAEHRIACAPDDLTAASQLEHSGLISREKYNHIVENIRAREKVREAMA